MSRCPVAFGLPGAAANSNNSSMPPPPPPPAAAVYGEKYRADTSPPAHHQRPRRPHFVRILAGVALGVTALSWLSHQWHRQQLDFWRHQSLPAATLTATGGASKPQQQHHHQDQHHDSDGGEMQWGDIEPSRSIKWHPCYSGQYDCARLDVPMDWLEPSDDPSQRVVLAVLRLRASNLTDYRGPVFFNPGGPGGSGVWSLKDHGKDLQAVVGDNHDIVSFDPRGIGASVPRVECWESPRRQQLWNAADAGIVDSHPGVLYDVYARMQAFSQVCESSLGRDGILRHSSTTYHARDMLEIANQMGQEKIKYWGFSYGTVLAGTFAAMFPDRIERMVSDGNVDLKEWYYGGYINFLRDTDKVMEAYYTFCHEAGPLKCAFYESTPDKIKQRLDRLLANLKQHPVIVPASEDGPEMPELVTYSKLKRAVSTSLYQPLYMWKNFSRLLAALEAGDGSLFYEFVSNKPDTVDTCSIKPLPPSIPFADPDPDNGDAFPAIMCSDAEPLTDGVQDFVEYSRELDSISKAAGAVNILFKMSCVGRTIRSKWRFAGPFVANTSHPILFIANIADNITPLISATNNSAGFPGSVVLVQNSYGHTSLSAPSTCTARYIREYFQDGTLPAAGSVCEPDNSPFDDDISVSNDAPSLTRAIHSLAQKAAWVRPPRLPGL